MLSAAKALEAGRPDQAAQALVGAMASHPNHPEVLRLEAGMLSQSGQSHAAVRAIRAAVEQRPDDALYQNTFGTVLANVGEFDGAIDAFRRACELQPNLAMAWYNLGIVLTRCVRYDEAGAALRKAVDLEPGHMQARAQLADALKTTGHVREATLEYRKALAAAPWAGMAWWGLANIKTLRLDESDAAAIRAALRDPRASDDDRIAMGFALAKAEDDQGRYAESFAALSQANAIARRRSTWNAAAFAAALREIEAALAPSAPAVAAELGHEVVFVVGMPRSGTTLVEQILASHSRVEGAGELPDLPLVINEESARRRQAFPNWVPALAPAEWERLGRRYLERTRHWLERRPVFVDKLPNNWIYLGAIRRMLPGAHIVVCRRDPLETCLSCYRQHFAGNDYTRSFEDLAAYWREFDRSARHFAARDAHVCEHRYEDLLAAPEQVIRRLVESCGLPFEDACLRFHETRRDVRSPSGAQVRQPLRADTARAARYGNLLDPLRKALGIPLADAAAG